MKNLSLRLYGYMTGLRYFAFLAVVVVVCTVLPETLAVWVAMLFIAWLYFCLGYKSAFRDVQRHATTILSATANQKPKNNPSKPHGFTSEW